MPQVWIKAQSGEESEDQEAIYRLFRKMGEEMCILSPLTTARCLEASRETLSRVRISNGTSPV